MSALIWRGWKSETKSVSTPMLFSSRMNFTTVDALCSVSKLYVDCCSAACLRLLAKIVINNFCVTDINKTLFKTKTFSQQHQWDSYASATVPPLKTMSEAFYMYIRVCLSVNECVSLCILKTLWTPYLNKRLANAKRPCDCRVLCLRLKSSLCCCALPISDMTSFSCRHQGRDSVCPVLWMSTWRNSKSAGKRRE